MRLIKEELQATYQFLKRNANEGIIIASAMLFITLWRYHPILNDWFSSFFYFGILPLMVIVFVLRKNPLDFGLRLGDFRVWLFYVSIFCTFAAIVLYAYSFDTSLQDYYRKNDFNFALYLLMSCVNLSASEFMYRGFLLFGLKEKFKEGSILLQMIPFVMVHFGKPEIETISTIITGILFGYIAYRGKSYWPAFMIHLFINVFFVGMVNL